MLAFASIYIIMDRFMIAEAILKSRILAASAAISILSAIVLFNIKTYNYRASAAAGGVSLKVFECVNDSSSDETTELKPIQNASADKNDENSDNAEKNDGTEKNEKKTYIKWVDFNIPVSVLRAAAKIDIDTHTNSSVTPVGWIDLLSLLAAKYGGNFSLYKQSDLKHFADNLASGKKGEELSANLKLYKYYSEAYGAVLGGMLGKYIKTERAEDGTITVSEGYGLRVYSPFARGYYYSHSDDFGKSRSFGYKRQHLGHDMMGSVGTPIICVESGYVEALGWNMYGGWRVGIRSFDGKRYYYYAHMRRNHPYNNLYEGKIVNAGEVIGYLGMTGYSRRENVNNIKTPHLHIGLQVIFDPSQKDGWNQIWIDVYELTKLWETQRAPVYLDKEANERFSRSYMTYPEAPD